MKCALCEKPAITNTGTIYEFCSANHREIHSHMYSGETLGEYQERRDKMLKKRLTLSKKESMI